MVHAAMAALQPGEVLVLTMPEPAPVALVGDLLATQAKVHGAAAILVDASVRDLEELVELGLPIWARYVRIRGAVKQTPGELDVPVEIGGSDDPARATSSSSTPTARPWSSTSASPRCSRAR